MRDSGWVVKQAIVSGAMGAGSTAADGYLDQVWRNNQEQTAFTERKLDFHIKGPVYASPSLDRESFVALFDGVVRHLKLVRGDQWKRVRKLAYTMAFGAPNDNIACLPTLKDEFEKCGHSLEKRTMGSTGMKAVTSLVRKVDGDRCRRKAEKVSPVNRSALKVDDTNPWAQQKAGFLPSHTKLLN